MPGFNLVTNRHLYLDIENNEREEVNSACDFVSGKLSDDKRNDFEIVQETDNNRTK